MPAYANETSHVVLYRTGGWMNAKWHATVPAPVEKAKEMLNDVRRMGYKAHLSGYKAYLDHGLPMGFCRHADSLTGEMAEKTCGCE